MKKKTTSKKPPLTTKRSKSGTKKSQQKNGLPDSNPLTSAKNTLAKWRQLFADNQPGSLEIHPSSQDGPIAVLLRHVDRSLFLSLSSERSPDSIQEDLIRIMKASGVKDIENQYLEARRSARSILFDVGVRQVMRFLENQNGSLEMAVLRAVLIEDPNILYSHDKVAEYLHDGIVCRGSTFLQELAEDFKNAERRGQRLGADDLTWVMAANWTNPNCPLWLMERPAIYQACRARDRATPMTESAVEKRLKTLGLRATSSGRFKRATSTPIKEVVCSKEKIIQEYWVKGDAFASLHGKVYPFSFHPQGNHSEKTKVQQEKCEVAWKKMNESRKRYGEESPEYRAARRDFDSIPDEPPPSPPGYRVSVEQKKKNAQVMRR